MGGTNNSTDYQTTQYNVLVGASNNQLANVAPSSTAGYLLTSGGASANPSFASFASGAWVLLQTQNASSSASITFTSTYITSPYTTYMLVYTNVVPSSTTSGLLYLRLSTNNGSTYLNTGYTSGGLQFTYNSSTVSNIHSPAYFIVSSSGSFNLINGYMIMNNLNSTSNPMYNGESMGLGTSGAAGNYSYSSGYNGTTTAVNNIQIAHSTVNLTSGSFSLYGLVQ